MEYNGYQNSAGLFIWFLVEKNVPWSQRESLMAEVMKVPSEQLIYRVRNNLDRFWPQLTGFRKLQVNFGNYSITKVLKPITVTTTLSGLILILHSTVTHFHFLSSNRQAIVILWICRIRITSCRVAYATFISIWLVTTAL